MISKQRPSHAHPWISHHRYRYQTLLMMDCAFNVTCSADFLGTSGVIASCRHCLGPTRMWSASEEETACVFLVVSLFETTAYDSVNWIPLYLNCPYKSTPHNPGPGQGCQPWRTTSRCIRPVGPMRHYLRRAMALITTRTAIRHICNHTCSCTSYACIKGAECVNKREA